VDDGGDNQRRAVAIIRTDLAGARRWRYELNMCGLARRHRLKVVEYVRQHGEVDWPTVEIVCALRRNDAEVVIAPSVAHVPNPRVITEFAALYVVGRGMIFQRGHRWPTTR
jgi:hypothetical protein